jgi:hypothetical protein
MARRIRGRDCAWATTEQITTSGAASTGSMTCSQNPRATRPVPKPASPLTKPAVRAPAATVRTRAAVMNGKGQA